MIRLIFCRHRLDSGGGVDVSTFETVDVDSPEIEQRLSRGGFGAGYDWTALVGAEVLPAESDQ